MPADGLQYISLVPGLAKFIYSSNNLNMYTLEISQYKWLRSLYREISNVYLFKLLLLTTGTKEMYCNPSAAIYCITTRYKYMKLYVRYIISKTVYSFYNSWKVSNLHKWFNALGYLDMFSNMKKVYGNNWIYYKLPWNQLVAVLDCT